jgi:hypothetical protein
MKIPNRLLHFACRGRAAKRISGELQGRKRAKSSVFHLNLARLLCTRPEEAPKCLGERSHCTHLKGLVAMDFKDLVALRCELSVQSLTEVSAALRRVILSKSYYEYQVTRAPLRSFLKNGPLWIFQTLSGAGSLWISNFYDTCRDLIASGTRPATGTSSSAAGGAPARASPTRASDKTEKKKARRLLELCQAAQPPGLRSLCELERARCQAAVHALGRLERALAVYLGRAQEELSRLRSLVEKDPQNSSELRALFLSCDELHHRTLTALEATDVDAIEEAVYAHLLVDSDVLADLDRWASIMKEDAERFITLLRDVPRRWNVYLTLEELSRIMPAAGRQSGKRRGLGFIERLQRVSLIYPSHFARNWIRYLCGTLTIFWSWTKISAHREHVMHIALSVRQAVRGFWDERIITPLTMIYREIFQSSYRTFMDPKAVQAEKETLKRMVVDFTREAYARLPDDQRHEAELLAANGDLTPVMKVYERQIRSPVVNMLAGDVIRALLIQVQKLKVDVEQEMVAVDSLVRSNELNLQIAAAVPGVLGCCLAVALLYRWFRRWWSSIRLTEVDRFGGGGYLWANAFAEKLPTRERARLLLRDIERYLVLTLSLRGPEAASARLQETPLLQKAQVLNGRAPASLASASPERVQRVSDRTLATFFPGGLAQGETGENLKSSENSVIFLSTACIAEYEDKGRILLTLDELEAMVTSRAGEFGISRCSQLETRLREDLLDLRSFALDAEQKLLTILRMRSTYPFLSDR